MSWIEDLFSARAENLLGMKAEEVSSQAAAEMMTPQVEQLVHRQTRRAAQQWMNAELGVPVETHFRDVYQFVDEFIVEFYAVKVLGGDTRWCSQWWAHPAAVRRLTQMWVSWEHYRIDSPATGEETWARLVGDYHFGWLTGVHSPFILCGSNHSLLPPLASDPMPVADPDEEKSSIDHTVVEPTTDITPVERML